LQAGTNGKLSAGMILGARDQVVNQSSINLRARSAAGYVPAVEERSGAEAGFTAPVHFTLKDWRLWVASFAFFWTLFVCGVVSMYGFQRTGGGSDLMSEEIFTLPLIQDTIFAILAPFVFVIAASHPIQKVSRVRSGLLYLGGGVVFAIVHVFIRLLSYPAWNYEVKKYQWAFINWSALHFTIYWPALKRIFLWNLVEDIFAIYIPIIVVAHAVLYYTRYREREIRAAQLQAQLSDAKLLALKSQLQPHFLFNTLHSISSLMLRDVQSADTMIARLSDLLRMSLEDEGQHLTSLKRELDFTQAYLDIEKIRFGDRLTVAFDVPPEALDILVPHFLLQPLVENSIKHGMSKRNAAGEIVVRARATRGTLDLMVRDNGSGRAKPEGCVPLNTGIGLKGTRERLRTLYGNDQRLDINFLADGAVEVTLSLPFRKEARLTSHESRVEGVVAFEQS
jgi:two-component system LytT family sensor kinase